MKKFIFLITVVFVYGCTSKTKGIPDTEMICHTMSDSMLTCMAKGWRVYHRQYIPQIESEHVKITDGEDSLTIASETWCSFIISEDKTEAQINRHNAAVMRSCGSNERIIIDTLKNGALVATFRLK